LKSKISFCRPQKVRNSTTGCCYLSACIYETTQSSNKP